MTAPPLPRKARDARLATAHRIRATMLERGLTSEQLAEQAQVTPKYLQHLICGIQKSAKARQRITDILGTSFWKGIAPRQIVTPAEKALLRETLAKLSALGNKLANESTDEEREAINADALKVLTEPFFEALAKWNEKAGLAEAIEAVTRLQPFSRLVFGALGERGSSDPASIIRVGSETQPEARTP